MRGCCVRVWTDNAGAERSLVKGCAKAADHNDLVHAIWLLALRLRCALWAERACSEDNLADLPSRESYECLEQLGARWVPPVVPREVFEPRAWHERV